ncbi:hypothetical protein KCP76_01075 [Salmonella enterica subsp. enterica serovar Weltevreden]|nr:hypothetical protein KCP76_01075 [Salmonella enterica subsp. enterica serovar Weltevreden]
MRFCYKTIPPDGIAFYQTYAGKRCAEAEMKSVYACRRFTSTLWQTFSHFLQEHDRLIREIGEQPVDARLVMQDVVTTD